MKTRLSSFFLALGLAFATALPTRAADPLLPSLEMLRDPENLALASSIPVQESGRIKPLDNVARFRLLRFKGNQGISLTDASGKKTPLSAMEWLLITWFRPDVAKDIPLFVVDNSDAIAQLNLNLKEKRDRYSYNELLPGRAALMKEMQDLRGVEPKDRSIVQRLLGKLSADFLDYEMMLSHYDFARAPLGTDSKAIPAELLPANTPTPRIVPLITQVGAYLKAHPEAAAPMANPWMASLYRSMLGAMMSGNPEQVLRIFPPQDAKNEIWQGPGPILEAALNSAEPGAAISPENAAWLTMDEDLYLAAAANDASAFKAKLKTLHDAVTQAAAKRGENSRIMTEVNFHKADYFFTSLYYSCGACILLALSWVSLRGAWGRWCVRLCAALMLVSASYAVTGLVIRCIIMQRPPITTLYETIIFISTAGMLFGLIAELMTRKTIALAVACIAGTVGLFISIRYMDMEGTDTLQQLQAVLITNFWLATHVPTINLGYTAGMVAAILSMIYFVLRLVGKIQPGSAQARDFNRIGYGFVMAGLFLSLVGTILGGIWANYSWGRFWGWDPKENGALMIVLMNLVILHARLGGYVKEVGFHCCNIVLGMIVAFSWFGVNQLGVGLHAYGFTEGIWFWLSVFWGTQLVILAYGIFLSFYDRDQRRRALEKKDAEGAPPEGRPVAV